MESFVSRMWVSKDEPKKGTYGPSTNILPTMSLDEMFKEIVDTVILNQESNAISVVRFEFAGVYLLCKYIPYSTEDLAKVFSDTGAYNIYVNETMRKVAEALKYTSRVISNAILERVN